MEKLNLTDFVMVDGDKLVTNSYAVAGHFGKRHAEVLRAFRGIRCSDEFIQRNFALVMESMTYTSSEGVEETRETGRIGSIQMTCSGFMFLAMGFTGKKADSIKEAYINAFDSMAEHIKTIKTLEKRAHDLEIRDIDSKISATFGSYLMLTRKKEKKLIERERLEIENEMQPHLFYDADIAA